MHMVHFRWPLFLLSIGLHLLYQCFVSSLFFCSPLLLVNRSVHQSASFVFFCLKTCTHILQKPVTPINVHRKATLYTQCQSIVFSFLARLRLHRTHKRRETFLLSLSTYFTVNFFSSLRLTIDTWRPCLLLTS